MAKGKVLKRPKQEGIGDSPDSCAHMKSLRPLTPASKGVTLVGEDLFQRMKGVIEQEKVIMPSSCMRDILPLPVSRVPRDDEPAVMDSTPLAPTAA